MCNKSEYSTPHRNGVKYTRQRKWPCAHRTEEAMWFFAKHVLCVSILGPFHFPFPFPFHFQFDQRNLIALNDIVGMGNGECCVNDSKLPLHERLDLYAIVACKKEIGRYHRLWCREIAVLPLSAQTNTFGTLWFENCHHKQHANRGISRHHRIFERKWDEKPSLSIGWAGLRSQSLEWCGHTILLLVFMANKRVEREPSWTPPPARLP